MHAILQIVFCKLEVQDEALETAYSVTLRNKNRFTWDLQYYKYSKTIKINSPYNLDTPLSARKIPPTLLQQPHNGLHSLMKVAVSYQNVSTSVNFRVVCNKWYMESLSSHSGLYRTTHFIAATSQELKFQLTKAYAAETSWFIWPCATFFVQ